MKTALGLVEIRGLTTAILVADVMLKTANVNIVEIENTKGLGWMTIKITGDVGAVNAAVNAGKQIGEVNNNFVSSKVIARPSDNIEVFFCTLKEKQEFKTIAEVEKVENDLKKISNNKNTSKKTKKKNVIQKVEDKKNEKESFDIDVEPKNEQVLVVKKMEQENQQEQNIEEEQQENQQEQNIEEEQQENQQEQYIKENQQENQQNE